MQHYLRDIADIGAGQGAPQGDSNYCENGIPFVKAGNLQELTAGGSINDIQKVSDEVAKAHKLKLYPKGTVLFAKSGMSCLKGYVYVLPQDAYVVNHLACITPNEDISDYLRLYFNYHKPNQLVKDAAYPSISLTDIGALKIDTKDEDARAEIIKVLSSVEKTIELRKQQLHKHDELIKARFIEMFGGDPFLNEKDFPLLKTGDIIDFQGGSQPPKKYFEYEPTENNVRLIQIRDYKTDAYKTYIPKDMAKRYCTADDIMIGRYGPPIFQILEGIEGSFNVALMKATPKMGNKEFVRQFLKQDCLLHYLEGMSTRTAGQDGIQMDKLKEYPFPMPPIELQEQFEGFVQQVDKLKIVVQKSLDEAQLLFDSLMQEYFG